ncbi:ABC transporter ATP-binding protein [Comamonas piscis]|uniref:ABC transporter ATP-binding protein n=1 Tax=Comamonas piscis TaxID=1562974 RepID=A0A7G5ED64_9BURK|nr:ABC transporter ATP-binding protein [Comamonas piscis]QMV71939.1 ABC transporter ATP-binding protein [Comamonas piscis]WSO34681.1 ABC transporter ATP-binding protein [Comamonas piscis]
MSFLRIEGLAKRFGDFVAVKDFNLEVHRGEFVSLLGPSGCGKTTTLQMIAGFLDPSQGRIVLDGKDITQLRPEQRGMGVVFQSYALFPHMTVEQNISFGLEMRKLSRDVVQKRIQDAIALVRLHGLGARYPRELSGGQRQRVAIARALAIQPEVLLLDEPMSNLDAKLRQEMHVEMRAIQRQLGITTILVTHDQVEAMTMSDRIAVMHNGQIAQVDSPQQIYDKPTCDFASVFLGKTNRFEGQAQSRESVKIGDMVLGAPSPVDSGPVVVYLRPERIAVGAAGDGGLPGTIKTLLFLGSQWVVNVSTALGDIHISLPNARRAALHEGAEVSLNWAPDDVRVLTQQEASRG